MIRRKKSSLDQIGEPLPEKKQFRWIYEDIPFTPAEQETYNRLLSELIQAIDKIIEEDNKE